MKSECPMKRENTKLLKAWEIKKFYNQGCSVDCDVFLAEYLVDRRRVTAVQTDLRL